MSPEQIQGRKFWAVKVLGSKMTISSGIVGSDGRSTTKECGSQEKAVKEAQKLVSGKEKDGYVMGDEPNAKTSTKWQATAAPGKHVHLVPRGVTLNQPRLSRLDPFGKRTVSMSFAWIQRSQHIA